MHKDKPPGIFDFAERSIRHLIGFWLITGFILSILVQGGLLLWRADRKEPSGADSATEALEAKTDAHRTPPTTSSPASTASVRY
jgi:hypothetical protein